MLACVGLWAQELIQQQPVMYTLLEKLGAEQPEIITLVNTGSF